MVDVEFNNVRKVYEDGFVAVENLDLKLSLIHI